MKKRTVPFGYCFENGTIVQQNDESKHVCEIFRAYMAGNSLQKIADKLYRESVEYLPGRSDWDKARIKRILDEKRYLGNDTYPAIITPEDYKGICQIRPREQKNQRIEDALKLAVPIQCETCGEPMKRIHDPRNACSERWRCCTCGISIGIPDKDLSQKITDLLNRLIANPQLLRAEQSQRSYSLALSKAKNEVEKMLDDEIIDEDHARDQIMACAGIMYEEFDSTGVHTNLLRAAFEKSRPLSSYSNELLNRTVTTITLRKNKTIMVILKMARWLGRRLQMEQMAALLEKRVRAIPPTIAPKANAGRASLLKRVAAYCRVSTKQEEQLNSYAVQVKNYTEKIANEAKWKFAGIYADKGISGTSTRNRDEFNRMIRACKRGSIDLILTKSISRFARNTVDCLKYVRLLRSLNVDVYFEEQNIHSIEPSSEFYITVHGSLAQSESENISRNVAWGMAHRAKEGKVSINYKRFLGYRRGSDGKPEIDPEQAKIVRLIYNTYLAGASTQAIADDLTRRKIPTATGKEVWSSASIRSILANEKYKGDALLNKTYVVDCISKKIRVNAGERPQYYVENNHPAIIDAATFGRVQAELARRAGKRKVKQVGTKTEQGKYCGKYALTELLVCGHCGTPYRRCTWTSCGKKKIVWRCINRLDFGTKYCTKSASMEEKPLQDAIMSAILKMTKADSSILSTLQEIVNNTLADEKKDNKADVLKKRIAAIEKEFQTILAGVTTENQSNVFSNPHIKELMHEKHRLETELEQHADLPQQKSSSERMQEIEIVLRTMQNHQVPYDDLIARQLLQSVVVESKHKIKVVFIGGMEVKEPVYDQRI